MKKMWKRLAICLALVTVLSVSAFAADFTHCADALKDLGLFQGTASGYQLDRAPTRAEAAAMLVRLLGKEEAAKATTYAAPFTDVPAWAQPYVQYLYAGGLTSGKTATTFAPDEKCTAQQYATFLLRALGYSDKDAKDFSYDKAIAFATEKGVVDFADCNEKNFLRDHVVAMSYTALATAPKTGEADLLTKLVKDGAIKDAKGYDQQFQTFRSFSADPATNGSQPAAKSHMKVDVALATKMAGMDFLSGTMNLDMQMDMNLEKMDASKFAATGKMDFKINPALVPKDNTMAGEIGVYYADGWCYENMAGQKVKMPMSYEEILGQISGLTDMNSSNPLCMIQKIEMKTVNALPTYTISYAGSSFNGMLSAAMGAMDVPAAAGMGAMTIDKVTTTLTVKNGKLASQVMDMAMSMVMEDQKLDMSIQLTMTDVGGTVNVVLPADLSTYVLMDQPAPAPAA